MHKRPVRGLVICSPYIEQILSGRKTWEIRGSRTKHVNEPIALIKKGSGRIVGTCEISEVIGPLTLRSLRQNASKAGSKPAVITRLRYRKTFAWVLRGVRKLQRSRPYRHPSGAVIWVRL